MANGKGHGIDPTEVADDVNPSPMVRKLRKDNSDLRKRVEELKLEMGENEAFFDDVRRELEVVTPLSPVVITPPKESKVSAAMSAVLVLSDWHIGEYVEPDEIEEFNAFSWAIAQKRVYYLVKQFINWVNVERVTAKIDEVVILVNGDLISGDIHHELQVTNEFPSPVQCVRSGLLLAKAVAELAPHFKEVRVVCTTADNHARLTVKPQYKQAGLNSFGYMTAWIAKERLSSHKNVDFEISAKITTPVEIQGHRYLSSHGNTIRGWAGFPWYGADRKVAREAKARRKMPTKSFDKMIIGHFHVPLKTMEYIVNGSLSGTTELDHGQGRHAEPCQVAWLQHPKYGEYQFNEFWLQYADDEDFGGKELVVE